MRCGGQFGRPGGCVSREIEPMQVYESRAERSETRGSFRDALPPVFETTKQRRGGFVSHLSVVRRGSRGGGGARIARPWDSPGERDERGVEEGDDEGGGLIRQRRT